MSLDVYTQQTEPLINYYKAKGLIREVKTNNDLTPAQVFELTRKALS